MREKAVVYDVERTPELEYVDPVNLHSVWRFVRPALEKHAIAENVSWLPEDCYMEIKLGKSQLFLGRGGHDGFAIVSRTEDSAGGIFWLWFVYAPGKAINYWDQIMEMAKASGATRIAFATPLPMWEKLAAKYGFKESRRIYEREI